jgi:hypothetical protein
LQVPYNELDKTDCFGPQHVRPIFPSATEELRNIFEEIAVSKLRKMETWALGSPESSWSISTLIGKPAAIDTVDELMRSLFSCLLSIRDPSKSQEDFLSDAIR